MLIAIAFLFNALLSFALGLVVAWLLGPTEFGRYGIAVSAGVMVNAVLFEWVRLSATRFYSTRTREQEPQVRATLDTLVAGGICLLVLGGVSVLVLAPLVRPPVGIPFLLAIGLTALSMGLFDYGSALLRARFLDRAYGRLVIAKNAAMMAMAVAVAALTNSATATAIAAALGAIGSMLIVARTLADPGVRPVLARRDLAWRFAAYGLPIVAGNALLLAVPFLSRSFAAGSHGLTEVGFLALAGNIGVRLVSALGSALDAWLFQVAIRSHEQAGAPAGLVRVERNAALVIALLTPAMVGYALILPTFEAVFVPEAFHVHFTEYSRALLPGMLALGIAQYAFNPVFQINRATKPITIASGLGLAVACAGIWYLPGMFGAIGYAYAEAAGLVVASAITIAIAGTRIPMAGLLLDVVKVAIAVAAMAGAIVFLQTAFAMPPVVALPVLVAAGGIAYLAVALLLDAGGLRSAIQARISRFQRTA